MHIYAGSHKFNGTKGNGNSSFAVCGGQASTAKAPAPVKAAATKSTAVLVVLVNSVVVNSVVVNSVLVKNTRPLLIGHYDLLN